MPYKWVEPEDFDCIEIAHAYKDDDFNHVLEFSYQVRDSETEWHEFDIRDLPVPEKKGLKLGHTDIIQDFVCSSLVPEKRTRTIIATLADGKTVEFKNVGEELNLDIKTLDKTPVSISFKMNGILVGTVVL